MAALHRPRPRRDASLPDGDSLDRALLGDVADGDVAALGGLWDRHAPRLHGMAGKVVQDPAAAQRAVAVAFVEVWHRAQDPAHGTVAVWLTSLVHRHAVEAARGVTARSEPEDLGASRGRLDALSESQREAVELSYFGALTYREIASRVGVTPATILARLHDALVVLGVRRRPAG